LAAFPSQSLTATVSNFGGLGSFGAHGIAPQAIQEVIAEIRSLTSKPFAMNLWVSMEDEDARPFGPGRLQQKPHADGCTPGGIRSTPAGIQTVFPCPIRRSGSRVARCTRTRVQLHLWNSAKEILDECRARSIVTIGAATTPDEAVALDTTGVDAAAEDSPMGTFPLVPQVPMPSMFP
jgi:nitronate monooxygenase